MYVIDVYAPLTYGLSMICIETPIFTQRIKALVDDDFYAKFQRFLADNPKREM
jgi:hypothetical protein